MRCNCPNCEIDRIYGRRPAHEYLPIEHYQAPKEKKRHMKASRFLVVDDYEDIKGAYATEAEAVKEAKSMAAEAEDKFYVAEIVGEAATELPPVTYTQLRKAKLAKKAAKR